MEYRRHDVQCLSPAGLHRMAYQEWGDPQNPRVLVCVHGLTRVSSDFDALASRLCDTYRVVCPDVVGRGYSGHLANPAFYAIPQYVSDMVTLLARVNAEQVDWVGTSMGGLIGMILAAQNDSPIRQLVLNDVGPALDPAALARIGTYVGNDVRFATRDEAVAYIRAISDSFGPHSDAQWDKMAGDVLRQNPDGSWRRHYDLRLSQAFASATPEVLKAGEQSLWAAYDAIQARTLLIRGAESDLLTPETAAQMQQRGPKATLAEFAGVGHAPMFQQPDQIQTVIDFLLAK